MPEPVVDFEVPADKVHVYGKPKGVAQQMTNENVAESIRKNLVETREEIFQLPSHEEGLNMDRVHAFREKIGIPRKEIRVLNPEDYVKALKIVGAEIKNGEEGMYLAHQDVIVVRRNPYLEVINGPEFIESLIVHEIAHSANGNKNMLANVQTEGDNTNIDFFVNRSGFRVNRKSRDGEIGETEGKLLEEGYAELERGIYVVQELGKPYGFGATTQPKEPNLIDKYYWVGENAEKTLVWTFAPGSMLAMMLEVFMADPGFLPALRKSRHSVEGLREVIKRMNAIAPDSYRELREMSVKSVR